MLEKLGKLMKPHEMIQVFYFINFTNNSVGIGTVVPQYPQGIGSEALRYPPKSRDAPSLI